MLGLLCTFLYWLLAEPGVGELATFLVTHLDPYGFIIMLAGFLSMQVLYHYFTCFSEDADSTVMASWLAAAPIFVYLGAFVLALIGVSYEATQFSLGMSAAVLLTAGSLALLERFSYQDVGLVEKYRKNLILMILFNTAYILLIDQTIAYAQMIGGLATELFIPAMLPMYWLGFAAGLVVMLPEGERRNFLRNSHLRRFLIPIIIVEVFGMFVFFFEFLGLGELDSVTVSVIVSLHVLLVWLVSVLLSRFGHRLTGQGVTQVTIYGTPLQANTLEDFFVRGGTWYAQLFLVLLTIGGVSLFFLLSEL